MNETRSSPSQGHPWMLLAGSILLAAAAAVGVISLLWFYLPPHLGHFAEVGATLPLVTRLAITTSNWLVRLLPPLILLGVPALALALGLLWASLGTFRLPG